MTEKREGDRLFRAWAEGVPQVDEDDGRTRFLAAVTESRKKPRDRLRSRARLVAFAIAAAFVGVCAFLASRGSLSSLPPLKFTAGSGDGQVRTWLATGTSNELPLSFSEGTQVVVAPDSRGRVEQLGPAGATFLLERGEVRAHVVHRTKTDWRFLAGPFEVEVTGTSLGVTWDPARERFSVRVQEGAILVKGPYLGALRVVRAGEQCDVDLPSKTMRLSSKDADAAPPEPARDEADVDGAHDAEAPVNLGVPKPAAIAPSWRTLEDRGDYDGAYAAATTTGLASLYRASSSDDLLRLAQVSQLSGHRDTERQALLACRRRFSSTQQASVAAYELGRASSRGEAATWFDTYLREQPSGPLAREALGRLVEARAAAANDAQARDAAQRYLARYPDGPQAPLARRVLAGAPE